MAIPGFPTIPETITVHLGPPDTPAQNVTVPFLSYVKNVASNELYPTWPISALRANVYAIVTFALNRIYNEWYPSKGYDFDITNTTAFDQKFSPGTETFRRINYVVDDLFDSYVRKKNTVGPYFTSFCNGTTTTCNGLSQWGTVDQAKEGKNSFQILQSYYGNDIELVGDVPVAKIEQTYPGKPLRVGDISNDVARIELQLNRIADNYPAIPKLEAVNGVYGPLTEGSGRAFQKVFNLVPTGIVDKATWYQVNSIYNSVKKLGELESEGLKYEDYFTPYNKRLELGCRGVEVEALQYYLRVIGNYYTDIEPTDITGVFDEQTLKSLKKFQTFAGMKPTGVVELDTVRKLQDVYSAILDSIPLESKASYEDIYPGYALTTGLKNDKVTQMQTYLKAIAEADPNIPPVQVTGTYDKQTYAAVKAIQNRYQIPETGNIGPVTWYRIVSLYRKDAT